MSVHLELTRALNGGELRAVLAGDPALVLHRLTLGAKDGCWILRETEEAMDHVLGVLARPGARYRFGAPLDMRWMAGGWSAHLEFHEQGLRARTDFFTRPPRVRAAQFERMWAEASTLAPPFADARVPADMRQTRREQDDAIIRELASLPLLEAHERLVTRAAAVLLRSLPA